MNQHKGFIDSPSTQGLVLVFLATLMFSCKGIFIKLAYAYSVEPAVLMFLRMLMALPFYLWVMAVESKKTAFRQLTIKQITTTCAFGFSGYYLASYLDLTGLVYLPANIERLILYTYPSIVLLLSVIFLKQRLSLGPIVSLSVIYTGLLIVFIPGIDGSSAFTSDQLFGATLVFASAIAFAIYFIGSEVMMRQLSSKLFTSIAMMAASIAIVCHFFIHFDVEDVTVLHTHVYIYSFLIAIFCTVLPSFFLSAGIRRVGAAKGSIVGGIGPVATLVMAVIILGESITALQFLGFVVVIGGVWNLGRLRA